MRKYIDINGYNIAIKIYKEKRRDVRFSLGKTGFLVRLPNFISEAEEAKQMEKAQSWIAQVLEKHPEVREKFTVNSFQTGDQIKVREKVYILDVTYGPFNSHYIKRENNTLYLRIIEEEPASYVEITIKQLISRMIGADFLPVIQRRVHELNTLHFKQVVGKVALKYNQSNWGSCSSTRNINLSTRLLFAPQEVLDYVIIHELAHLVEMNHSDRFWALVEKIMPNYQAHEEWLKANAKSCDFVVK
ncbi:MAG: M48 family metallopeptidase [Saprospiraceae bacterium]|nr:M48 family metallopeptidase [Saprospiraceae bacterium]